MAASDPAEPAPVSRATAAAVEPSRGLFWTDGVALKGWPILVTVLLGLGIPGVSQTMVYLIESIVLLPGQLHYDWASLYYQYAMQIVVTLAVISLFRRFLPSDYGLRGPAGKSFLGAALFWGLIFGVVMAAVDFWPQIVTRSAPEGAYALDAVNVVGWLSLAAIAAGPADEVLYRGLLVTYLGARVPGRIGIGRYGMSAGGVVSAAIFSLAYFFHFLTHVWYVALGQMVYGFVFGLFLAYWLEKSKSLLAPIVGSSLSGLVRYGLMFAMVAAWR